MVIHQQIKRFELLLSQNLFEKFDGLKQRRWVSIHMRCKITYII
jgi:hypothetical protein